MSPLLYFIFKSVPHHLIFSGVTKFAWLVNQHDFYVGRAETVESVYDILEPGADSASLCIDAEKWVSCGMSSTSKLFLSSAA